MHYSFRSALDKKRGRYYNIIMKAKRHKYKVELWRIYPKKYQKFSEKGYISLGERIMTQGERRSSTIRENRLYFIEKWGGQCRRCGWKEHPLVLQFDHAHPEKKDKDISKLMHLKDRRRIWKELNKCNLLCPNCHWIKSLANNEIGGKRHKKAEVLKTLDSTPLNAL